MPGRTITELILASAGDIGDLALSWGRDLRAANLSPHTVQSYLEAVRLLAEYPGDQGMLQDVASIHRDHVGAFIEDQLDRHSPAGELD